MLDSPLYDRSPTMKKSSLGLEMWHDDDVLLSLSRYNKSVELLKQQKTESDETDKRHQRFIDQLLKEKRQLAVQYETAIREMEAKHETAVKVIEERHKVEMKKAQEKFNAAEKIRRDKWIDTKTKKIKELTVRGLEPELERMATAHQEELAELRRVHQRQLTEAEAAWARRTAALREQEACERQAAVQHEREAARHSYKFLKLRLLNKFRSTKTPREVGKVFKKRKRMFIGTPKCHVVRLEEVEDSINNSTCEVSRRPSIPNCEPSISSPTRFLRFPEVNIFQL
ncbi:hypothetical protein J6590_046016 [Homalodisca vitripennis]|nr:hypothetical protein J6590_046016 [Homalodisca vitripennis]